MAVTLQLDHITELVHQLSQGTQKLASGDSTVRLSLAHLAGRLTQTLEIPQETILRMFLANSTVLAMVKVGFNIHLFDYLSEDKNQAIGSAELAEKTGVERALLIRILRNLASSGLIGEVGPDQYHANGITKALAHKLSRDTMDFYDRTMAPALNILPEYFIKNGYRDPKDGLDAPSQMAFGTKLHIFEYIQQDVEMANLFKSAVLSQEYTRRAHWEETEFYPVKERLLLDLEQEDDSVVMVDIGGGMGLDLLAFHDAHPEPAAGRLILQDTEQVLSSTGDLAPRIEKMPHDFFHEQPVKGAHAYYLHRVFHDWSDDKCREILLALKPALIPGYSRVLIQDNVVLSQGASLISTASDILMMVGFAGKERTEEDFKALFESVGMEVTGIWTRVPGEESVVEAIVPVLE